MSLSPDYVPLHDWDELLSRSVRRGRSLRRRRHALLALPTVAAVLVGVAAYTASAPSRDAGPSRLEIVDELPEPLPDKDRVAPPVPNVAAPVVAPVARPASRASGRPAAQEPPSSPVVAAVPRAATPRFPVLEYGDAEGDAAPGGTGNPQASAASAPEGDIVRMRFGFLSDGLHITMTLAAPPTSTYQYGGWVTDPVTGCQMQVHVGLSSAGGYYLWCDGAYVSGWVPLPPISVTGASMSATVPWASFPTEVDPRRALSTEGHSYITNSAQPVPVDAASSTGRITRGSA